MSGREVPMLNRLPMPVRSAVRRSLAVPVVLGVVLSLTASAFGGVANRGLPHASRSNPLAGMPWGVYTGRFYNSIYPEYQQAQGSTRQLLGKIALRPLMFTFGDWFSDSSATSVARDFIANSTHGNP